MITLYNIGYFINLFLLANLLYWLISTNSWTPGKKAVTVLVGAITWNYTWACAHLLYLNSLELNTIKAFGFQFPTLASLFYVHYIMRSHSGSDH